MDEPILMTEPDKQSRETVIKYHLYRRRYLVPNAVTLGNMFCGYLSMMYASTGRFEKAIIAIAFAILLDGLDGRVARRLNATSKFGMEFDSFSDLVSFGVAPAFLVYNWGMRPIADEFGVLITFIFVLCSASRLARFNLADENLQSFTGLPTPGAAGVVGAVVNYSPALVPTKPIVALLSFVMVSLAYLMVSRVEFFSIKSFKMRYIRFFGRVALGLIIALIWYDNKVGFLVLAIAYALSGPIGYMVGFPKRRRAKREMAEEVLSISNAGR